MSRGVGWVGGWVSGGGVGGWVGGGWGGGGFWVGGHEVCVSCPMPGIGANIYSQFYLTSTKNVVNNKYNKTNHTYEVHILVSSRDVTF